MLTSNFDPGIHSDSLAIVFNYHILYAYSSHLFGKLFLYYFKIISKIIQNYFKIHTQLLPEQTI